MTDHPVYRITRPSPKLLTQYVLAALLAGPLFPLVILPAYFKYKTLQYRFDEEGIAMSWGLLWRREIYLTYARIQDIHLARGLVERWLGLATIQIQTASGSASAEMSIVGLVDYELVRDHLYSMMRGARLGEADGPTSAGATDETSMLLTEIRDELRSLRARLGGE